MIVVLAYYIPIAIKTDRIAIKPNTKVPIKSINPSTEQKSRTMSVANTFAVNVHSSPAKLIELPVANSTKGFVARYPVISPDQSVSPTSDTSPGRVESYVELSASAGVACS